MGVFRPNRSSRPSCPSWITKAEYATDVLDIPRDPLQPPFDCRERPIDLRLICRAQYLADQRAGLHTDREQVAPLQDRRRPPFSRAKSLRKRDDFGARVAWRQRRPAA